MMIYGECLTCRRPWSFNTRNPDGTLNTEYAKFRCCPGCGATGGKFIPPLDVDAPAVTVMHNRVYKPKRKE